MKLPNLTEAVIPQAKITRYLLCPSHPNGRSKAEFFSSFGFNVDSWQSFADALYAHANAHDVSEIEEDRFGVRYTIEGALNTPDGRTPSVLVVWFIETGEVIPRLVTAYPSRRRTS